MKTVALIPIKLGSERVPGKNIKPFFDGTPLMHFIQRVCIAAKSVSETYVYCSDESITTYLLPGVKFLNRPEYLNGNAYGSNHIIAEFIKVVDADIYIETHATSPFANSETFDTCVNKVASNEYDSAFCAERLQNFLWRDDAPLNFDLQNFPRTQDLPTIYAEAPGAYVFSKATFNKYGRRVGVNPYIHEVGRIEATDIDYPIDFDVANAIYKELIFSRFSYPPPPEKL
jgi:CMP-N-acetylneuraminic acid synthetase